MLAGTHTHRGGHDIAGKHYRWQTQWTVSLDEATARHDSGLVVRFTPLAERRLPPDLPEIGTTCWTLDGTRWMGALQGGDTALNDWLTAQAARGLRDTASVRNRLARLMREAGEIYVHTHSRPDHAETT